MGVDIINWLDIQIDFKTILDLRFHLARNLNRKICILYSTEVEKPSEEEAEIFIGYPHKKDLGFKDFDYKLCIYDENKKMKNIETDDIQPLLKNQDVLVTLMGDEDAIEIEIFSQAAFLWDPNISDNRWYSFLENITNPVPGFTERVCKQLYLINNFAKAFNSQNLLLTGDSGSKTWGKVEFLLQTGSSMMDSINSIEKINVITSNMILTKNVKIDNSDCGHNNIILLSFQDVLPYLGNDPIIVPEISDYDLHTEETLEVSIATEEDKGKLEMTKKVLEIKIIKDCGACYYKWVYKTFDYYGRMILSKVGYGMEDEALDLIKRSRTFNYNSIPSCFYYKNRCGKKYSLSYRTLDSEISFSLWDSAYKKNLSKEFKEFIDEIFEIATKAVIY